MRNTGWNFLLTSSLHGTNLTCKTVVNTWQKSSLQLQCINKHVFFGWYYQKSSNLHTFFRKIANFWFTRFRGQFLSKIWMGGSLYFSMTGGGALMNWVGGLSEQWKIIKVNHFLRVLVIQTPGTSPRLVGDLVSCLWVVLFGENREAPGGQYRMFCRN